MVAFYDDSFYNENNLFIKINYFGYLCNQIYGVGRMNVSIVGTTGYGGIELVRILHRHPEFNIQSIHSTKDEVPLSDEYPHLYGISDKRMEGIDYDKIAKESELVFLATPSGVSSQLVAEFLHRGINIIDLSGDMRLKKPSDYSNWYKKEPLHSKVIQQFVYGLSEWEEEAIKTSKYIANPGCYATAALLGLAPIVREDLIEADSIIIDAKSGVSGAGKSLIKSSLYAEVNENLKIYKVNEHQHTPEIEQQLKIWNENIGPITFSTHLVPLTRGIMATIYVKLKRACQTKEIRELYRDTYRGQPFIRIRPEGVYPGIKEVTGSNYCDIGLHVDSRTGRLTIISVIDNLMKGAAGQAVQNANLMVGLDSSTGLEVIPLYP